jgi:protein-S-isoprenylcysteine O-methyltransferase Ste14
LLLSEGSIRPLEPAFLLPRFLLSGLLAIIGLLLLGSTIGLFVRLGKGTLAPWDSTKRLVVSGPYRRVRNPMISGVILLLLAEFVLTLSPAQFLWFAIFSLGNALYIPLSEEKGLEARFGGEYARYKRHVPRWVPRLNPWRPEDED